MVCFGLAFVCTTAAVFFLVYRSGRWLSGLDFQVYLGFPSLGASEMLANMHDDSIGVVPAAFEPAHKDPALPRHRPWIVRGWVGGEVVRSPGGSDVQVCWLRDGRRLRWFEKKRGLETWTVVMVRARLRVPHGFQACPRAGVVPPDAPPLSPATWEALIALARVRSADPVLEVHPTRIWVSLPGSLFDSFDPPAVLDAACRVVDVVLGESGDAAESGPVRVVGSDLAAGGEAAFCPVCGDPVGEEPVRCLRCSTPHHGECWDYVGACSVFGCRSTEKRG